MKINKFQLRMLIRSKELQNKPFPVMGSFFQSWKLYLIISAIISCYAWWSWSIGAEEVSIASLGFLVGLILRDITWLRLTARMWPINEKIIDWNMVDEIIKKNDM